MKAEVVTDCHQVPVMNLCIQVPGEDEESTTPDNVQQSAQLHPHLTSMVLNTNLVMNEALSPAESNGWSLEKAKAKVSLYTRDQDGINTPAVKALSPHLLDCSC